MKVQRWMSSDVVTVHPDNRASEAWNKILSEHIRQVPVVKGEELLGIVSRTDLLRRLKEEYVGSSEDQSLIRKFMTLDPETIAPDAPIEHAASRMYREGLSSLPVVHEGEQLVGILTKTDLFRALTEVTGFKNSVHRTEFVESNLLACIARIKDIPDELDPKSFLASRDEESGNWNCLIHHEKDPDPDHE